MRYFTFIYRRFETLPIAIRAAWWMCLSAFAYAASIAIVHHLTHRLPVFEIALGRNVFALVFMLPWLYSVGLRAMRTSHLGMHAIRGLFSAANVWFLFGSLALAPVADVSAITFLMPIIAAIFLTIKDVVTKGYKDPSNSLEIIFLMSLLVTIAFGMVALFFPIGINYKTMFYISISS